MIGFYMRISYVSLKSKPDIRGYFGQKYTKIDLRTSLNSKTGILINNCKWKAPQKQ